MANIWGYKVAIRPTLKCRRKLYRYMVRRAVLYDRSYLATFEILMAEFCNLEKLVKKLTKDESVQLGKPGSLIESFALSMEKTLIAPIDIIYLSPERVWIRVHPAASDEVKSELVRIAISEKWIDHNSMDMCSGEKNEAGVDLLSKGSTMNPDFALMSSLKPTQIAQSGEKFVLKQVSGGMCSEKSFTRLTISTLSSSMDPRT